jgi:G3E family GTPase
VETTGLADPAPVVQTLASDTLLAAHYRLDGLITLVDGLHGVGQIDQQTEAVKQIAIADKILVTKTDLTSAEHLETLCGRIRQLNSHSPIEFIRQGEVDPKRLIDLGLSSSRASLKTLQFLGEALTADAVSADGAGRYLGQRSAAHNAAVKTLSLRFTEPFEWLSFSSALELLTTLRGPDLLRMKRAIRWWFRVCNTSLRHL